MSANVFNLYFKLVLCGPYQDFGSPLELYGSFWDLCSPSPLLVRKDRKLNSQQSFY